MLLKIKVVNFMSVVTVGSVEKVVDKGQVFRHNAVRAVPAAFAGPAAPGSKSAWKGKRKALKFG
jgi:hypothetical protein